MPLVNTTAGPVEASELGRTLVHEHLLATSEAVRVQWPHLYDEAADLANSMTEVRRAQEHGVSTICDPGVLDIGRDVRLNMAVTKHTGVRFVMATGAYGVGFAHLTLFPGHLRLLPDLFVHDLEVGIQGTEVKAGFIKVACDEPGMVRAVERLHRAAAEASLRTGAPIMAHSNPSARTGLAQMEVFIDEGVAPGKVQIAHCGDTSDVGYSEAVLETGCFIGMDRYGVPGTLPTDQRNATVVALVERGHASRMMLSQDSAACMDGRDEARRRQKWPDAHMTYIFESVIPPLLALGIPEMDVEAMISANVHAWLGA